MKKTILSLAALTMLFAACKKNDDSTTTVPASQRILGAWLKTEDKTVTTTNGTVGQELDNMAADPPCAKDDLYNFLSSGMLVQTEGATKCRPQSDPDTVYKGMYALFANDAKLITKYSDGTPVDTFDIVELSTSTLRLKNEYSATVGNNKIIVADRITYSKK